MLSIYDAHEMIVYQWYDNNMHDATRACIDDVLWHQYAQVSIVMQLFIYNVMICKNMSIKHVIWINIERC